MEGPKFAKLQGFISNSAQVSVNIGSGGETAYKSGPAVADKEMDGVSLRKCSICLAKEGN